MSGCKNLKVIIIIILVSIIPIKITSTAPVEVVPKNPILITSPFDGVVKNDRFYLLKFIYWLCL